MSFENVSLSNVVFRQYQYKLRAYIGVFTSLVVIQVLAILLSLIGPGIGGFSNGSYAITVSSYSPNIVIIFTMVWAFVNAIILTTKAYREDDFTFVSNRQSYNLSNMAILLTVCIVGAVTSLLANSVVQLIVYFTRDIDIYLGLGREINLDDFGIGLLATVLYVLLVGACGYLIGTLAQISRYLILLIVVLVVGLNFVGGNFGLVRIFGFYFQEQSFLLFMAKTLLSIFACCGLAVFLSNRLEVRK